MRPSAIRSWFERHSERMPLAIVVIPAWIVWTELRAIGRWVSGQLD